MTVRDNEFNKYHCQNCHEDCGDCQDTFEEGYVTEFQGLFRARKKTKEKYVWRYAQRRVMNEMAEIAKRSILKTV